MPKGQNSSGRILQEDLPAGGPTTEVQEGEIEACAVLRIGNTHAVSLAFHLARLANAVK